MWKSQVHASTFWFQKSLFLH